MNNSAIDACYRYVGGDIQKAWINEAAIRPRMIKRYLSALLMLLLGLTFLPAVAAEPEGSVQPSVQKNPVDALAEKLAGQVLMGGRTGEKALKRALTAAGFTILRAKDKKVLSQPKKNANQGLAFDEWEVQGMGAKARQSVLTSLSEIKQLFVLTLPTLNLRQEPLAQLILQDIRARARDKHPGLRFWARFIVELGRRSAQPYDLMGKISINRIQLSFVQLSLIYRRMSADFHTLSKSPARGIPKTEPLAQSNAQAPETNADCTFTSAKQTITNDSKAAGTIGFLGLRDKIMKRIEKPYEIVVPDAILAHLKAILSLHALTAKIHMNEPPLIRTTETDAPGETRTFVAQFSLEQPNDKWHICARQVLKKFGTDYKEGPLDNVEVDWHMMENPRLLQWAKGNRPTRRLTQNGGITTIDVDGKPQARKLPTYVIPTQKLGWVWLEPQLKRTDIYNSFSIVKPPNPLRLPAELLERTKFMRFNYDFPVIDWISGEFHAEGTNKQIMKHADGEITLDASVSMDLKMIPSSDGIDGKYNIVGKGMAHWKMTGTVIDAGRKCTIEGNGNLELATGVDGAEPFTVAVNETTYSGNLGFHSFAILPEIKTCREFDGSTTKHRVVVQIASGYLGLKFDEDQLEAGIIILGDFSIPDLAEFHTELVVTSKN